MDRFKRPPTGEGFRDIGRGGELAEDDSVEGHIMGDEIKDQGQDVEGHMRKRVADDDVEGHARLRRALPDDDTEGHAYVTKKATGDDDTEGHAYVTKKATDEDDVEGHARKR